jgi:rhodanese-related sulfurtransferase
MTTPDTPSKLPPCDVWEIRPADVPTLCEQFDSLLLLDCRTEAEHREDHIEGAMLLPIQEISLRAGELDPWRDRVVVVYCRSGRRSLIVAHFLAELGFQCVRSVAGGIQAWREAEVTNTPC